MKGGETTITSINAGKIFDKIKYYFMSNMLKN